MLSVYRDSALSIGLFSKTVLHTYTTQGNRGSATLLMDFFFPLPLLKLLISKRLDILLE